MHAFVHTNVWVACQEHIMWGDAYVSCGIIFASGLDKLPRRCFRLGSVRTCPSVSISRCVALHGGKRRDEVVHATVIVVHRYKPLFRQHFYSHQDFCVRILNV